ncbi:MAG: carbon-nitrogen hydrolase family protein [Rhodoferax sp.]
MKVAVLQMVSSHSVDDNLQQAHALLERAAQERVELAVLPEYFCLMGHHDADKLALAEPDGHGPLQQFLSRCAREFGLWLVGGTVPLEVPGQQRAFNSCLVYAPDGQRVARYDKLHLFRYDNGQEAYDESVHQAPGSSPVHFDLPSQDGHTWRVGLSVCYDLRFPELYRHYAQAGAHLLLAPSAFTYTTGADHWELLLRTRAVENLCFVAAAAQGGMHSNHRRTWGHAMVVDPWGKVLAQRPQDPGVVRADLDWNALQTYRNRLPALNHRVLCAA